MSWVNRGVDVANDIVDFHLDRYDAMMALTANAPAWTAPLNSASVIANILAQSAAGTISAFERASGAGEGAVAAMLPFIERKAQHSVWLPQRV